MLLTYRRIISLSLQVLLRTFLDIVNVEPSGMKTWLRVGYCCTYAIETEVNILRLRPLIQHYRRSVSVFHLTVGTKGAPL
jgi:hypothetical protein